MLLGIHILYKESDKLSGLCIAQCFSERTISFSFETSLADSLVNNTKGCNKITSAKILDNSAFYLLLTILIPNISAIRIRSSLVFMRSIWLNGRSLYIIFILLIMWMSCQKKKINYLIIFGITAVNRMQLLLQQHLP